MLSLEPQVLGVVALTTVVAIVCDLLSIEFKNSLLRFLVGPVLVSGSLETDLAADVADVVACSCALSNLLHSEIATQHHQRGCSIISGWRVHGMH